MPKGAVDRLSDLARCDLVRFAVTGGGFRQTRDLRFAGSAQDVENGTAAEREQNARRVDAGKQQVESVQLRVERVRPSRQNIEVTSLVPHVSTSESYWNS